MGESNVLSTKFYVFWTFSTVFVIWSLWNKIALWNIWSVFFSLESLECILLSKISGFSVGAMPFFTTLVSFMDMSSHEVRIFFLPCDIHRTYDQVHAELLQNDQEVRFR